MTVSAILALEDGSIFRGKAIGATGDTVGDVVFNTTMCGYQEILTTPAYAQHLVAFTYPHAGNTGVNDEDNESSRVHAAGLIVRDLAMVHSNWRSKQSLADYLKENKVVAIADIDTRRLTRLIREKGVLKGCIMAGNTLDEQAAVQKAKAYAGLKGQNLTASVTTAKSYAWDETMWSIEAGLGKRINNAAKVVVYDLGVTRSLLRQLASHEAEITVVPANTPVADVVAMKPNAVVLSGGPGDPAASTEAQQIAADLLKVDLPVLGIGLGFQVLALAAGASSLALAAGRFGGNHSIKNLDNGKVLITVQNRRFAIDKASLPATIKATHVSLFDDTLQGIKFVDKPIWGCQWHAGTAPEVNALTPILGAFLASAK